MIHTATLVHDDVLDQAETRRHVPTINAQWDEHTSILLGDYLFADQDPDRIFASGEGEVISIDTVSDTMTFAGNARASVSRKQLSQWIRQAPPNA